MKSNKHGVIIQDGFTFFPYQNDGYQCIIKTIFGPLSIRFGGQSLAVSDDRPYEVWYPDQDEPTKHQTAQDIWGYISTH